MAESSSSPRCLTTSQPSEARSDQSTIAAGRLRILLNDGPRVFNTLAEQVIQSPGTEAFWSNLAKGLRKACELMEIPAWLLVRVTTSGASGQSELIDVHGSPSERAARIASCYSELLPILRADELDGYIVDSPRRRAGRDSA